jgi:hypothetical protein
MGLLGTCGVPASSCCRHVDISTAVHRAGVPSTSGPLPAHGPSPAPVDAGRARRTLAGRFPDVVRHPRRSAAVSTTSRHCRRRPGDDASSEQAVTRCTPVRPQTVHILGDNSSTSRPGTGRSPLRTASPARSAGREQGCPQLWRSRPGWERRVTSSRPAGCGQPRGTCGHRGAAGRQRDRRTICWALGPCRRRWSPTSPQSGHLHRAPGGDNFGERAVIGARRTASSPKLRQLLGTRGLTAFREPDFPDGDVLERPPCRGPTRGTSGGGQGGPSSTGGRGS